MGAQFSCFFWGAGAGGALGSTAPPQVPSPSRPDTLLFGRVTPFPLALSRHAPQSLSSLPSPHLMLTLFPSHVPPCASPSIRTALGLGPFTLWVFSFHPYLLIPIRLCPPRSPPPPPAHENNTRLAPPRQAATARHWPGSTFLGGWAEGQASGRILWVDGLCGCLVD